MRRNSHTWPVAFAARILPLSPRQWALRHGIDIQTLWRTAYRKEYTPRLELVAHVARLLGVSVPEALALLWPHLVDPAGLQADAPPANP